jgi:GH24 family phage-related lysozyme (muramidase)
MAEDAGQLTPSQYLSRLKIFEGYADHLYLDTVGKITVGVGLMFGSAESLAASHITFRHKATGKIASAQEVREEFKRIAKLSKGRSMSYYRHHGLLAADSSDLQGRLVKRLSAALTDAIFFFNTGKQVKDAKFEEFADLPANVQLALLDMAFNLGRGKLGKYQSLRAYLKQGDWTNAAKQSHRRGIQSARNETIYNWIFNQPKDFKPIPKRRVNPSGDSPARSVLA